MTLPSDNDLTTKDLAITDTLQSPEAPTPGEHSHHGYISDKSKYLARLKRIEGQARGIHRMVDEEQYCIDILTQISALTKAIEGVALGLLDDHLKHCVVDAAKLGGDEAQIKIAEASAAIARLVRS
ncbi:DNA-binding FrmR family transcriptional regulator [Nakamurella sp. UYEF19]|uniref:metal-sensitive transcriptional regulator n=1 Tax=Nakamurella sp. UYEF19 TaxID=1756392 RepID=UPI003395B9EA